MSFGKPPLRGRLLEQGFTHLVGKNRMTLVEGKRKEKIRKRKAVDDREAWWATVHRVPKSWKKLND